MELRPLLSFEKEMQSLIDRVFGREVSVFRPVVDVVTEGDMFVATFEIPGIDPDKDVVISVENDVLIVKGEKTTETEIDEEHRHLVERTYGRFERIIPLPEGANVDDVVANYDKGVLTVRIPVERLEAPVSKKIPVSVG